MYTYVKIIHYVKHIRMTALVVYVGHVVLPSFYIFVHICTSLVTCVDSFFEKVGYGHICMHSYMLVVRVSGFVLVHLT